MDIDLERLTLFPILHSDSFGRIYQGHPDSVHGNPSRQGARPERLTGDSGRTTGPGLPSAPPTISRLTFLLVAAPPAVGTRFRAAERVVG
jgi:hypothetical protein